MKLICFFVAVMILNGCALLGGNVGQYTATTEASYEMDGKKANFKSNKEYTNLEAEFDPSTGKFFIKVDQAGTPAAAIAALARSQEKLSETMAGVMLMLKEFLLKAAPVAAAAGS